MSRRTSAEARFMEGGSVKTWLNGAEMADIRDQKIAETNSVIALQIHDGGGIKVRWKNIRLLELK